MFRNFHFHPCRRPAPCTRRSCGRSVRPKHRVAPCDIYPDSRRALRQPLPQRPAAEPSAAGKSAARSSESRFPATAFSDCPTAVSSSALPTCPSRSEAGFAPATAHTVLKGRNTPHANSLRSPQSAPSRAQPSTVAARPLRSAPAGTSAERSPPQTSARSVRAADPAANPLRPKPASCALSDAAAACSHSGQQEKPDIHRIHCIHRTRSAPSCRCGQPARADRRRRLTPTAHPPLRSVALDQLQLVGTLSI